MSNGYDTGELSTAAIRALKRVVDQYAMVEVVLADIMAETAKLPSLTQDAAREIQYAYSANRAALYGACDETLGEAVSGIGRASTQVKAAHEAALSLLEQMTDVAARRPRTKELHRFADDLKAKWPGAKFGR